MAPCHRMGRPRRLPKGPPTMDLSSVKLSREFVTHPTIASASFEVESSVSMGAALVDDYYKLVHPFVPILPHDSDELKRTILEAPANLKNAINRITYPSGEVGNDGFFQLPQIECNLPDIQAAILFVHVYYGSSDPDSARTILLRACQYVFNQKWHLIDDPDCLVHIALTDNRKDLIRRAFWELWSLEIMLAAVTGIRTLLLSVADLQIKTPRSSQSTQVSQLLDALLYN